MNCHGDIFCTLSGYSVAGHDPTLPCGYLHMCASSAAAQEGREGGGQSALICQLHVELLGMGSGLGKYIHGNMQVGSINGHTDVYYIYRQEEHISKFVIIKFLA